MGTGVWVAAVVDTVLVVAVVTVSIESFISYYNVMDWVKGNLLTLLSAVSVIIITVLLAIPVELAFLIWFVAFLLDASYTFLNRRYVAEYELNVMVRRNKHNIVIAFVQVILVEFALIASLSLTLFLLTFEDTSVSVTFVLFAVIHILAFIRSYEFMRRING